MGRSQGHDIEKGCRRETSLVLRLYRLTRELKRRPPADSQAPAKTQKIAGCFLPGGESCGEDRISVRLYHRLKHPMGTPKPEHNHPQPAGNQPWGHEAVRSLPPPRRHEDPSVPSAGTAGPRAKFLSRHSRCIESRESTGSARGKRSFAASRTQSGQWESRSFLNSGNKLNGISPVGGDLPVAILACHRSDR